MVAPLLFYCVVGSLKQQHHRHGPVVLVALRQGLLVGESNTYAAAYFFVAFNHITQAFTETVFIKAFSGIFIPQTAAIWAKLIAQHHLAIKQAKLKLIIH